MSPIKQSALQSLRLAKLAPSPRVVDLATRAIASTTRYANSVNLATSDRSPQHFSPQDFRPVVIPRSFSQPRPQIPDFNHLLRALTSSLTTTPQPHLPTLTALLRAYTSDSSQWQRYAHANASKQYTRNLVCEVPGVFNLLLLVWTPGKQSPVHDHADAHCLMKVLKGDLVERRFQIPETDGEMMETSKMRYMKDKVTYMSDELGLHEISNPSQTEFAVSLHLYTPPNAAMRGCHVYDVDSGESRHVTQGLYDSMGGVPTSNFHV